MDDLFENENITTPTLSDENLNSSSSSNETNSQAKEEPLVVKIRDTLTGEVTIQKMQPDQVWNLEKNKKIIVELNGDGQGSDNGSNLLVRFLGKLSQKSIFCPISVERWDRMPKAKKRLQWQLIEENFEFDYAVGIKWVMRSLCERWRAYKYKLRCENFYPNKSKEEILAKTPVNVDSIEWTAFVHHYKEDKMKFFYLVLIHFLPLMFEDYKHTVHKMQEIRKNLKSRMPVVAKAMQGEVVKWSKNWEDLYAEEKISEHLPQDQEDAATLGVPLKILAHLNDAIEKVYGGEHCGRVHGLGGNVCPSAAFGMPKRSTCHVNFYKSSNMSHQRVEDLEKHVETLEEKLTGYEETKKRLAQNEDHLATLHRFLLTKFGSELAYFNLDFS